MDGQTYAHVTRPKKITKFSYPWSSAARERAPLLLVEQFSMVCTVHGIWYGRRVKLFRLVNALFYNRC